MYKPFLLTLSPKNSPQTNNQPLNAITNICTITTNQKKHSPYQPQKTSYQAYQSNVLSTQTAHLATTIKAPAQQRHCITPSPQKTKATHSYKEWLNSK